MDVCGAKRSCRSVVLPRWDILKSCLFQIDLKLFFLFCFLFTILCFVSICRVQFQSSSSSLFTKPSFEFSSWRIVFSKKHWIPQGSSPDKSSDLLVKSTSSRTEWCWASRFSSDLMCQEANKNEPSHKEI